MEILLPDAHVAPRSSPGAFTTRLMLVSLLVFLVLAVVHRRPLFLEPWHEHSDYAVDAMHIERARHFEAIQGQFSRFGFNHPGPAFYYIYALGEQVFYRWLPLVPSPFNAHLLAGLLLQCFFFGAGLAIVDEWCRRPLLLPLALLTSTIHLALAGNAFIGIWPPRVLLMPFFCFVIAVASVAAGRARHLPLAVLAGCFLVHGHVAQPLYVVLMFLLAYGFAWHRAQRQRGGRRSWFRESRAAQVASVACIAVFLVPIAIDLCAGARSNLAHILEFQTSYRGPGKPLWKAFVYFTGFFAYVKKPELFLSNFGPDRAVAIGEYVMGYFVWAAAIVVVVAYARRMWLSPSDLARPFVVSLTAFTALAFLLSLYWGMVQIGPMYEYNGYFFYAILECILLLFCAAVSTFSVPRATTVGALLCATSAGLTWKIQHDDLGLDYTNNRIPVAVREALRVDPLPAAPKYLVFNRGDWGEAVSIALALRRDHHEFCANGDWGPKFTPNGGFEPVPPHFELAGMSTWRLSHFGPTDSGSPIRDNLRVYFKPLPLNPEHAVIDCAENGKLELYTLFGFESPLGTGAWTIRPYAGLVFDSPAVSTDLLISFLAEPFASPDLPPGQPMTLSVNGHEVFRRTLTSRATVTARVPAEVWNAKRPVMMVLHLPRAISPHDLKRSLDDKKFGWRIEEIRFERTR